MCTNCGCAHGVEGTLAPAEPLMATAGRAPQPWSPGWGLGATVQMQAIANQYRHQITIAPQPNGTQCHGDRTLLAHNEHIAAQIRTRLRRHHSCALNFVSSPGAGKTTLLTRTLQDLQGEMPFTVLVGDQATTQDMERLRATGCPALQVNTGIGCHLDAAMVRTGLDQLPPPDHTMVMVENVGNLMCPALFDLGEAAKIALLSVTEGEDKPLKYPHLFRASRVMILNKIDLLPYVRFDLARCLGYARQINPRLEIFQLSATTGAGLDRWYDWLRARAAAL
ncbi:MAG: hydrogenase nickel incorporation protein HypB [Cyanobacteria bacterium]|nr:hydrogenase nickel incorporation protein HypB [Cyanobacteriota bacterium]MEB3267491.1 hydrogenase nickel incorporation protein HypB [Leptolyngbya sp.]